jgi:transglutaminase-like putative cysteine protease
MTATAAPPRQPAHPPRHGGAPPPSTPGGTVERRDADPFFGSTLSLTALTFVATLGMGRLFADGSFIVPLCSAALVTHLVAWWARRIGLGLFMGALATAGALALVVAWVVLPHTTAYGIPWMGTWSAVSDALSTSWHQFSQVIAPAPVTKGFLIASMAGVATCAFLADWAAYRVRATLEPLLPPFTLFLFTSALGADRHQSIATAAFVGAALLFLVVHQAALRADTTAWFASRTRGGVGALLQGGAAIGLAAVVAAVFLGPNLPGADAKAILKWRKTDSGGRGDRVTTSPLVDIKSKLVELSSVEVFNVDASAPAYWQITTLDHFNGRIWSSAKTYKEVKERLPGGIDDEVADKNTLVQQFRIIGLSSIWLPAAFQPVRIEGLEDVSYNAELASLITDNETTDGLDYTVESEVPQLNPDMLRTADNSSPGDEYLELEGGLPQRVVNEARRIMNGKATNYDRARALQDYFRTGFTYDLTAPEGHSDQALENFLFRSKRGYCEQFSGAFAAMARAVGIPSRVAVGFTPGNVQADGRYHVQGLHAHAWPEVWLGQFGWVAFEPTPGRGNPGMVDVTGVPPAQDNGRGGTAPIVTPTTAPPTTAPPAAGNTPTTRNRDSEVDAGDGSTSPEASKPLSPVLRVLLAVAALALLWALVVPLLLRRRRLRRRAAAGTSGVARVLVAWEEAGEALSRAGTPRRGSETVHEYARRAPAVARLAPDAVAAMNTLAEQTAVASYSPGSLPPETVARSVAAAGVVETAVEGIAGWRQRLLWRLDPRPLVPTRTRLITGRTGTPRAAASMAEATGPRPPG